MKILLVDDHALFREGLVILLQRLDQSVSVVECGSCAEAFQVVDAQGDFDLIVLDLGLPDGSGLGVLADMRQKHPGIPCVVLSSTEDKDTVVQALNLGAMGYVPKTSSSEITVNAIKLILGKGIYLPPSVFLDDKVLGPGPNRAYPNASIKKPADLGLTPRQADVLYLILQGKPGKLICRELNLSASTVKVHTSAVLRALNVTSRTQAIIAASKIGLIFDAVASR
jgi:DNA-binding NarL/FixJ family response regulator